MMHCVINVWFLMIGQYERFDSIISARPLGREGTGSHLQYPFITVHFVS